MEEMMKLGSYEYGNVAYTGTPIQPTNITVFLKGKENGKPVFLQEALLPSIIWDQQNPLKAIPAAVLTLQAASSVDVKADCVKVGNIVRAMFACIFPWANAIRNHFIDNHDFEERIKADPEVAKEEEIVGFAIDGKVIRVISFDKVDSLTQHIAKLSFKDRLQLFRDYTKQMLKKSGEQFREKRLPLDPVKTILSNAIDSLEGLRSNSIDLNEMGARVLRIIDNREQLTKEECDELIELADALAELAQERFEELNASSVQPPKQKKGLGKAMQSFRNFFLKRQASAG